MKKLCDACPFPENPAKADARLHINSFLIGCLLTVLTLIWTLNPEKIDLIIISQLVLAIPLIFFASLSFSKIGYKKDHKLWDSFGWYTNNIGYLLFLNAVGLMVAFFSFRILALVYFGLVILLSSSYYIINIISQPGTLKEHLSKLILFILILVLLGVVPIIRGIV